MKKRKRLLAFFMALCCIFTMNLSAFATDAKTVNVSLQGNDGSFEASMNANNTWTTIGLGLSLETGKPVNAKGLSLKDPVFWDSTRGFKGWAACREELVTDDDGNSWYELLQIPGTKLLTTAELLNYTVPDYDITFLAQWDGNDDDYYSHVYIRGYGAEFGFYSYEWDDENDVEKKVLYNTESWGNSLRKSGESINDQVKDYCELLIEPTRSDATFEGWAEFKVEEKTTDEGFIYETYELVSNTIYTTAQMLSKKVADYDVAYVAKWSDIPLDMYFYQAQEYGVSILGEGGTFDVTLRDDKMNGRNEYHGNFKEGKALKTWDFSITDPVYWDSSRKFEGWIMCRNELVTNAEGNSWYEAVRIPGSKVLATSELLDYVMTDEKIIFKAQWAGNDDDYYSRVGLNGYGVQLVIEHRYMEEGKEIWREERYEGTGHYLKESVSGLTIGNQMLRDFKLKEEPSRPNDIFEGWAEFKIINETGADGNTFTKYELVSNQLYTTQEVLDKLVPDYNVEYVAKWKSIPLENYFNEVNNDDNNGPNQQVIMAVSANGGQIYYDAADGNGDTVTMIVPCIEYCFGTGMNIEFVHQNQNQSTYKSVEKLCSEHMGWKLYECENIDWIEFPAGQECNIGDPDIEIFYFNTFFNENQIAVDRYIILEFPKVIDRNMTTAELQKFEGNKNYFAIANWKEEHMVVSAIENKVEPTEDKAGSYEEAIYCNVCENELSRTKVPVYLTTYPVVSPVGEEQMRLDVKSELTAVPENVAETFKDVNQIKKAMSEAALSVSADVEEENLRMKHLDVELKYQREDGAWEIVTYENFPAEGLEVFLPYPDGTNGESKDFVITHLITEGEHAGLIEILEHREEVDGLYVKVTSLSPISIAYEKDFVADVFTDISEGKWYETGVQFVYDNGLMSGSEGLFNPTSDITRAQIVTTLYRLAGLPAVTDVSALDDFTDVVEDKYYTDAVCWAYAEGIATGNNGKFNPAGKLTRQQMAAFFFRFAGYSGMDIEVRGDLASMVNAEKVSGYAKEAVEWAVGAGLISGSETTVNGVTVKDLNPGGNTTRAQVAIILQRFCEE